MTERIRHTFGPVFDENSKVLILGSMPSVKSLEQNFYYAHPQNRFWKMMSLLTGEEFPAAPAGKAEILKAHGIALWDVLNSCIREGSLDSEIREAEPNDVPGLLKKTKVRQIFTNGKTAERYLKKFFPKLSGVCLPSTSPANAGAFRPEAWMEIGKYLKGE